MLFRSIFEGDSNGLKDGEQIKAWGGLVNNILSPFAPKYPIYDHTKFIPERIKNEYTAYRAKNHVSHEQNVQTKPSKLPPENAAIAQLKHFGHFKFLLFSPGKERHARYVMTKLRKDAGLLEEEAPKSQSRIATILESYDHQKKFSKLNFEKMKQQQIKDSLLEIRNKFNHKILLFPEVKEEQVKRRSYSIPALHKLSKEEYLAKTIILDDLQQVAEQVMGNISPVESPVRISNTNDPASLERRKRRKESKFLTSNK